MANTFSNGVKIMKSELTYYSRFFFFRKITFEFLGGFAENSRPDIERIRTYF